MDLVDRDRRAQRVDARRRGARMRQFGLVEDDRGGLRAHLGGKGERIGFQRQMLAVRSDDIELVVVAGAGMRNEQLPIADAAHAHRMPPRVPEIEIADHADAPARSAPAPRRRRRRRRRASSDARRACRRSADGCLRRADTDRSRSGPAESGRGRRARRRCRRSGRAADSACEPFGSAPANSPASWIRASGAVSPCSPIGLDIRRLGQERAHHVLVALGVQAEIVERVGVAALDDRIGLGGQFGHAASSGCCDRIRKHSGQRHAQPVGPVRQLVLDFVERLLKQEEVQDPVGGCGSAGQSRWLAVVSR